MTPMARRPVRLGHTDGQTMVEFALVLIIFMLVVLGIVDLSRAVYASNLCASAAREGARYASTHPTIDEQDDVIAHAKALIVGLDRDAVNVVVSYPDSRHVQVDVTYQFHPVTILIARYVDGGTGVGLPLHSRSIMRRER